MSPSSKKLAVRLLSIVCVFVLLMTTFQVVTANVSESTPEDMIIKKLKAGDSDWDVPRSLTLSDKSAHHPSSSNSYNGDINVAWIDDSDLGMSIKWKSSIDKARTFSSDRALSPYFDQIDEVHMICSDDDDDRAIVFEGKQSNTDSMSIYTIFSDDGGKNWSQVMLVCAGYIAGAVIHGGSLYLGVISSIDSKNQFVVIKFEIIDGSLSSGVAIFGMEVPESYARLTGDAAALHFMLIAGYNQRSIVYGSIDYEGFILSQPAGVWTIDDGQIRDLQLGSREGKPFAFYTKVLGNTSTINYGYLQGRSSIWAFSEILQTSCVISDLTFISNGAKYFLAWEGLRGLDRLISGIEIDTAGYILSSKFDITKCGNSTNPTLAQYGQHDIVCMWEQSTNGESELYFKKDVTFEQPNLARLILWLENQDPSMFIDVEISKSNLVTDVVSIAEAIREKNIELTVSSIDYVLEMLKGDAGNPYLFNLLDVRSSATIAKVEQNLNYYRGIDEPVLEEYYSSMSMMATTSSTDNGFYDIVVTLNPSTRSATISWYTTFGSTSNSIKYGVNSVSERTQTATNPSNNTYHVSTLNDLNQNTW